MCLTRLVELKAKTRRGVLWQRQKEVYDHVMYLLQREVDQPSSITELQRKEASTLDALSTVPPPAGTPGLLSLDYGTESEAVLKASNVDASLR
jgi:hypothetical protein